MEKSKRTTNSMKDKDNLLGLLQTIFKWKKYILLTCLAVGIGAIITVFLIPVYYKSTTVFYAASPDLADPSLMYGRSSVGMDYYGSQEDIDRVMSIAKSNELADFLIDEFNLYENYGIDTSHRLAGYSVRLELADLFNVKRTKEDAIELSIEDRDKELATRMVNAARGKINEIGQRLIKESLYQTVQTYVNSIREGEAKLDTLSEQLKHVRDTFGVYNVETQSDLMAGLVAKAESSLQKTKIKLAVLKQANREALRDSILVLEATKEAEEAQVKFLKEKLTLFNQGLAKAEVLSGVQLESSIQLGKDRERYRQILSVYNSSFPAIHVLEEGAIPTVKSRPIRSVIVVVSVLIAFLLSVVGVLIFDTYKDVNWREIYHGK